MFVGAESEFGTREGGHEQKQGGVRQVKVGEETVNPLEFVGRVDVGGRRASMGSKVRGGFQDANRGGADRDDAAGGRDFFLEAWANFVPLLVHGVVAEVSRLDWAEGAEADVKGDKSVMELRQKLRGEMEPGGGGSDGAGDFGVRGLVGIDVGRIKIGPALGPARLQDVGRERRSTKSLEVELFHERTHDQLAAGDGFFDTEKRESRCGPVEGVWKEVGARGEAFSWGTEGSPPTGTGFFKKQ